MGVTRKHEDNYIFGSDFKYLKSRSFQDFYLEVPDFEEIFKDGNLFENKWTDFNFEELNKNFEHAMQEDSRFDTESPDSGIEFDMDKALVAPLTDNSSLVIPLELPVIYSDLANIENNSDVKMLVEDESRSPSKVLKSRNNIINEVHSYSIMKIKKSSPKKRSLICKTLQSNGRKIRIPMEGDKKTKLYQMKPLNDPVAERNRLNALNAKKNRDKKKEQLECAHNEIYRLKEENDELRNEADDVRDELEEARREVEALKSALKSQGMAIPFHLGKSNSPAF